MSEVLFCPLRQAWVAALPEERVRQALIHDLTQRLGYPLGNVALEKSLSQLPHLATTANLPKRRADLIIFAKDIHPHFSLYPLLLIECKSVPLNAKTLRQLVGYNQFVRAPFISAINQSSTYLGWYHPSHEDYCFQEGLLSYEALLRQAQLKLGYHRVTA